MFATLLGSLPRPPLAADASRRALVEAVVRAQQIAGIEPVTDGGLPGATDPGAAWGATASLTERAVKQALRGPYSLAWSPDAGAAQRTTATLANAAWARILRALAAAGCPLIEIHEPSATAIGADAAERALFREAHRDSSTASTGHTSLAITAAAPRRRGRHDPRRPYASLAVDLIAGPDNWRLVADAPGDIGIVCGALSPAADGDDGPEVPCGRRPTRPRPGSRSGPGGPRDRVVARRAAVARRDRKIERLGAAAPAETPAREAVSRSTRAP
jgi:hypothetical protein